MNEHTWEKLNISNAIQMQSRTYHSGDIVLNRYLVVFGGEAQGDLNDTSILDLNTPDSTYKW